MKLRCPDDLKCREFLFDVKEREAWKTRRGASARWGKFAPQAASGRFTFSHVTQPSRHFGETLVSWQLEQQGYVCWTYLKIFRPPGQILKARAPYTIAVESLLSETAGVVPQREYERLRQVNPKLHLKSIDVVGFHSERRRWVFCEVKWKDQLHPAQIEALRFLRRRIPGADVFVGQIRERPAV